MKNRRTQKVAQFLICASVVYCQYGAAEPPIAPPMANNPALTISGNKKQLNTQCTGRNINIEGNNNRITLKGFCNAVSIKGNGNKVWVAQAYELNAQGNDNYIYWKEKVGGSVLPIIKVDGKRNIVKQKDFN